MKKKQKEREKHSFCHIPGDKGERVDTTYSLHVIKGNKKALQDWVASHLREKHSTNNRRKSASNPGGPDDDDSINTE